MKKTNIRINNFFIFIHNNKHYLTDIDILEDWKNIKDNELKKYTNNEDCSSKVNELIKLYGINSNVNFTLKDFKKYKKSLEGGEVRIISLKKGGDSNKSSM